MVTECFGTGAKEGTAPSLFCGALFGVAYMSIRYTDNFDALYSLTKIHAIIQLGTGKVYGTEQTRVEPNTLLFRLSTIFLTGPAILLIWLFHFFLPGPLEELKLVSGRKRLMCVSMGLYRFKILHAWVPWSPVRQ